LLVAEQEALQQEPAEVAEVIENLKTQLQLHFGQDLLLQLVHL
jgi:hypothetical protein|tara:strand:+ start:240 stop:368 length:129 start_codon:yes stop_codon:yes gene_type:complete